MRFLAFHGFGTNSSILETQLQALTRKLGSGHEFVYVDGEEEVGRARGLPDSVLGPYLGYYVEYTPEQISKALDLIKAVIEEDGPFDAVIGFSQGASLILSYLMQHEIECPEDSSAFRFAILFSPFTAISPDGSLYDDILINFGSQELKVFEDLMISHRTGRTFKLPIDGTSRNWKLKCLLDVVLPTLQVGFDYDFINPDQFISIVEEGDPQVLPRVLVPALIKQRISIPVVHVIGTRDDPLFKEQAECMKGLCTPTLLHCIKHRNGHDIPTGAEVNEIVREIEWAMNASVTNCW